MGYMILKTKRFAESKEENPASVYHIGLEGGGKKEGDTTGLEKRRRRQPKNFLKNRVGEMN